MEKIEISKIKEGSALGIDYGDLIQLYYFEALRHKRPIVDRKFEETTRKVAERLVAVLDSHPYVAEEPPPDEKLALERPNAALIAYFKAIHNSLKSKLSDKTFNAGWTMDTINEFLMAVHERIRKGLNEELPNLLGLSEKELHALNFIDIDKPLDQQEKIIFKKLEELNK